MTSTQKTTVDLQTSQQELIELQELLPAPPSQNEDLSNNRRLSQISHRNPKDVPTKKKNDNPKTTKNRGTNTTIPKEPKENLPTRSADNPQAQGVLRTISIRTQRPTTNLGPHVQRLHDTTRPHSQTPTRTTPAHSHRSTMTPGPLASPDRPTDVETDIMETSIVRTTSTPDGLGLLQNPRSSPNLVPRRTPYPRTTRHSDTETTQPSKRY